MVLPSVVLAGMCVFARIYTHTCTEYSFPTPSDGEYYDNVLKTGSCQYVKPLSSQEHYVKKVKKEGTKGYDRVACRKWFCSLQFVSRSQDHVTRRNVKEKCTGEQVKRKVWSLCTGLSSSHPNSVMLFCIKS